MNVNIPENTSKNTHNVVAQLLFEDNTKDDKVLDIPSGSGAFTQRLLKENIIVYSGDIENIMMVENEHFSEANMNEALPFEDGYFGSVVCIDGIEHLERPFDFVAECSRIIKRDGMILLSTPNINALRSRWRWFWTGHHNKCKSPLNENNPTPLHHINMMSYQRLRYILHTNGFSIEKITTNRVKFVSWLYAIFVPISWIITKLVYQKEEKDPAQRKINTKIMGHLFSASLLFGETMIIKAKKIKG